MNRFPNLSQPHAAAMDASTLKLDGQKVLFDRKVTLMPVALKKEASNHEEQKQAR